MRIPHSQLQADTLRALVEEFISREGTDYGMHEFSLKDKVEQVLHQIEREQVYIIYSELHESCTLISREEFERRCREGDEPQVNQKS